MKKMTKGMLMTALICGAVYLGGSPVYASELQEFALDEYVVTAARTETKLVDTPANISVVDSQTIEERHYQDVSEVLKDVPGANVLDSGVGAFEKSIRINGDDRVLVLVDGRRVNMEMGTTSGNRASFDMNQLPDVGLIERIEVLKGAGGALYGSDAVGGVINIITKKAVQNYGKISVGFGSNDARDMSAMYSYKENKTGITVSATKNKQGYYKFKDKSTNSTKRWHYGSDYENEKVSLKIDYDINENDKLMVGYDYSNYNGSSPSFYMSTLNFNRLDKETKNVYTKYSWNENSDNSGYIQLFHNELDYENIGLAGYISYGFMEEKTNGIDIQQVISTNDNNKLLVGLSWRESDVKTSGTENNYDEGIDNIAVFVNDTWQISPSWTLNAGIRYDNHSEAGNETTASAGLNKKFNDNSHAYINWGQVFKAPNTDDLFYNGGGMIGNRNLNPETGDTWTIGYSTLLNNKTDLNVSYFESDLDDAINWDWGQDDAGNYFGQCYNVDKQKKRGLEVSVNHPINDNVDLVASYTYLKVEDYTKYSNGYQRNKNVIPNIYRLGVNYIDGKWNSTAYFRAGSGASSEEYLDSNYITFDLAITYNATNDLKFYAKCYNLFNEAYAEIGGYHINRYNYPAQSRRFIVGAEYKF